MPHILAALIGYLLGAIPFGVIAARLRKGRDPRAWGSGHTGGLNTLRAAGRVAFILTGAGDALKGVAAATIVRGLGFEETAAVAASVAAIAGHCWSIYIGFAGGMGIGTFIGLTVYWLPIALLILVPLWFVLYGLIRHAPRTSAVMGLWPAPIFALLGGSNAAVTFGAASGIVIAIRHVHDWNRA